MLVLATAGARMLAAVMLVTSMLVATAAMFVAAAAVFIPAAGVLAGMMAAAGL